MVPAALLIRYKLRNSLRWHWWKSIQSDSTIFNMIATHKQRVIHMSNGQGHRFLI